MNINYSANWRTQDNFSILNWGRKWFCLIKHKQLLYLMMLISVLPSPSTISQTRLDIERLDHQDSWKRCHTPSTYSNLQSLSSSGALNALLPAWKQHRDRAQNSVACAKLMRFLKNELSGQGGSQNLWGKAKHGCQWSKINTYHTVCTFTRERGPCTLLGMSNTIDFQFYHRI